MAFPFTVWYTKHSLSFLRITPNLPQLFFGTIELDDGWMGNDEARPGVTVCVLHPIFSILCLLSSSAVILSFFSFNEKFSFNIKLLLFFCVCFCVCILHFEIIKVFLCSFYGFWVEELNVDQDHQAPFIVVVRQKKE